MSAPEGRVVAGKRQADLFAGGARMVAAEAVDLTVQSINAYGAQHDHWAVAWSGGKDSTATLTLLVQLIEEGRVIRPRSLSVFYADTRQELPPLQAAADRIAQQLRSRDWITVETVLAPLDNRFLVYILGRGVPPPNNNTFRWCTRQIKVDPMSAALATRLESIPDNVLMITGVRQGESAMRDRRIAVSCSTNGGECGQGWYQNVVPNAAGVRGRIATLAPLLHWRVCHVWDWLKVFAPRIEFGAWDTAMLADAYGGDDAEEINARTGCIGCPLASKELALETIVQMPAWAHLRPLLDIKPIYRALRFPQNRLRKTGLGADAAPSTGKNAQRLGPLTMAARSWALERIEAIQADCNRAASALGRPGVDLLNAEESARIRELIAANTWPNGWNGNEPRGDVPLDQVFSDGAVQPLLINGTGL